MKNTPMSHHDSLVVVGPTKAGEDKKTTPMSHNDSLVVLVVREDECNSPMSHCDLLVVVGVDKGWEGQEKHTNES